MVYADNRNVGKASVTIKGKGAYTGSIKKTFRIEKFDIAANTGDRFVVEVKQENVPYAKGGAKPKVVVNFRTENGGWRTLTAGTDYTLSYRNHKAVNDGSRADRQPAVIVKGKGNFGGVYGEELHYKIEAQDLGRLTLTAQDKTFQNKKNSYATKLSITDLNGKVLKAGVDYQKTFTYLYKNETEVSRAGGKRPLGRQGRSWIKKISSQRGLSSSSAPRQMRTAIIRGRWKASTGSQRRPFLPRRCLSRSRFTRDSLSRWKRARSR